MILKKFFNLSICYIFLLLVLLFSFSLQGCAEKFISPHQKYFEVFSVLPDHRISPEIFRNSDNLYMFADAGIYILDLNNKTTKTIYNNQFFSRNAIASTQNIYTFLITSKNAVSMFDLNSENVTNYSFNTSIDNNAFELFTLKNNVFVLFGGRFKEGYRMEVLDMNNPKQGVIKLPLPKEWIAIRKVFEEDTFVYVLVSVSTDVERDDDFKLYKLNKEDLKLTELMLLGKSNDYYYREYIMVDGIIYSLGGTNGGLVEDNLIRKIEIKENSVITYDMKLSFARRGGISKQLKDGKILFWGGDGPTYHAKGYGYIGVRNTMELIDLKNKKSTLIIIPNKKRDGYSIEQLDNGDLLLIGGNHDPDGTPGSGYVMDIHRFNYNLFIEENWDKIE